MSDFLSSLWPIGAAILVILGIVALSLLVVILYRASKTMKSVQNMAEEADKEITPVMKKVDPMVDKAELSIDTLNLEMLRMDAILEDVEQITNVAGNAANTVDSVTSAPVDAVTSIVGRLRGSFGSKRQEKVKQGRVVYPIAAGKHTQVSKAGEQADAPAAATEAEELAARVAAKPEAAKAPGATEAAEPEAAKTAEVAQAPEAAGSAEEAQADVAQAAAE